MPKRRSRGTPVTYRRKKKQKTEECTNPASVDKGSSAISMCGLLCDGEEGVTPKLQCERCLSLHHPNCVGQPDDTMSFLCEKCLVQKPVLGTLQVKVEPEEVKKDPILSEEQSFSVTVKQEPEDFDFGSLNSIENSDQTVVIKKEPEDSTDDAEWQPIVSSGFLWNTDKIIGEIFIDKPDTNFSEYSQSHIFSLSPRFAKHIDMQLPLTISIKGINVRVPPFGRVELVAGSDPQVQMILCPGVMYTLDRVCLNTIDNCNSFIASLNPTDSHNIILQDLSSQKNTDSDFESKGLCVTVITAFGDEVEYSPMQVCHNCLFLCKEVDGKLDGEDLVSFICLSCLSLRSSIITEDFSEPQHVPTDPRSRSILARIDAQEAEAGHSEHYFEAPGKEIKYDCRGHLIRLPNRLLDRTKLTQPLSLTINGVRVRVPPNGKVLLSKQYGAHVFIPEEIVSSARVTGVEYKSFIIMTSPSDAQNLIVQETGSKLMAKPVPSYQSGFFQTEISAALDFECAYKSVFNKEPPSPPPVLITDSEEQPGALYIHSSASVLNAPVIPLTMPNGVRTPAVCPFQALYGGYTCFLHIITYLAIKDRLRARLVCRNWKEMLMHYSIWRRISLFDCVVTDWQVAAEFMSRVNTRALDLRGLVHSHGDPNRTWHQFLPSLGRLGHLEDLEFDKCPAIVLQTATAKLLNLRSLCAMKLTGPGSSGNNWNVTTKIDVSKLETLTQLEVLELRGVCALLLTDGLQSVTKMHHLSVLSLTTLRNLTDQEMEIVGTLTKLEVLELGDCDNIGQVGLERLKNLVNLTRLRLEYRPTVESPPLADVLKALESLSTLELVKFILCNKLLETLENMDQLQSLVLWPETGDNEADYNSAVLQTLSKMTFLDHLEWGITSSKADHSAKTALFLDGRCKTHGAGSAKSPLRSRTKSVTISKVMTDLCSNLTQTKIKVFKLKMPQVTTRPQTSPTKASIDATHSASLRYVLNYLKSQVKGGRSSTTR